MTTLDRYQLDALEQAAADNNLDLRTDYSGRAMYGASCVGLVGDSVRDVARALVQLATQEPDLATQLAGAWTQDSMGKGVIVYFVGFQAESTE